MKPEKTKNGKWKYREKFKNPLTGKWQSVTVTYEKNNRHIEKIARKELDKRIEEKLSKIMNTKGDITLQRLTELYLADVKGILKEDSTYIMRTYSMKKIASVLGKDVLVLPTYVGVILPHAMAQPIILCTTHIRGGDPYITMPMSSTGIL